jgi:GTPase
MNPLVAIVGRPNVGKSTLFNRLARRRLAIVEDTPGVTRDRQYAQVDWGGRKFTLIDTGGFVPGEKDTLLEQVRLQAQLAVEECELTLFVVDGRDGVTSADREVATFLRKSGKKLILVANKLDTAKHEESAPLAEAYSLGLGDVLTISAEHNRGTEELMDKIFELLPPQHVLPEPGEEDGDLLDEDTELPPETTPDAPPRLAIVGRPNVGKSTLVNALLRENRVVASAVPGTTRDPIDSEVQHEGQTIILTDTAGIRRKKSIAQRIEQYAVVAALKAVENSDITVLLMDATEPAVDQDAKLAGISEEKGRALLIVVNKWDLVKDPRKQEELRNEMKFHLDFVGYAPILFMSALKGGPKVDKVLEVATELYREYRFRAPTPVLNKLLEQIREGAAPPIVDGRPLRLYYIAQVGDSPPSFAVLCNKPAHVPPRFKRFLVNQIRGTFNLRVPIRLFFRERPGQAKRAARKKPALQQQKRKRKVRKES